MTTKKNKFRVIQIGVGQMGSVWLNLLKNRSDIEIVGLADIDKKVLERLKKEFNTKKVLISKNFKSLISKLKPDFVIDVTPPKVRSKNLLYFLTKNINVLSEKPLVDSKEHLDKVISQKIKSTSTLMVSQNYRWGSGVKYLKQMIDSNKIGKITNINIVYKSNYKLKGWRVNTKNIFILDMAIHHIDLIRCITDANFIEIDCSDGVITNINGLLNNGSSIEYNGTWKSKDTPTNMAGHWKITGTLGNIDWDGGYNFIFRSKESETIIKIDTESKDKLDISTDKFVNYLDNESSQALSLEDNKHTLNTVFACCLSANSNTKIYL